MQPHLATTARIIAIAVVAALSSVLALFGQCTASADPVDDLLSEAALKAAFSLDPYLSSLPVTVEVIDGRTTVSGKLGHPVQKRLTMRKVRTVVDESAIVDRVSVVSVESADGAEPTVPADVATNGKPRSAIRETTGEPTGVAVPSQDFLDRLRRRAERSAEQSGTRTRQSLKVRAHDMLIAARTRRVLDRNIPDSSIQVDVRDGVVTLSGGVPEEEQSSLAEELVAGLSGVASIQNELVVEN